MTTKEALSEAMHMAAAHANRVRALKALSVAIDADEFYRLAKQHPLTIDRDLEWATADFQRIKGQYEAHCREIGVPAYATYSED